MNYANFYFFPPLLVRTRALLALCSSCNFPEDRLKHQPLAMLEIGAILNKNGTAQG